MFAGWAAPCLCYCWQWKWGEAFSTKPMSTVQTPICGSDNFILFNWIATKWAAFWSIRIKWWWWWLQWHCRDKEDFAFNSKASLKARLQNSIQVASIFKLFHLFSLFPLCSTFSWSQILIVLCHNSTSFMVFMLFPFLFNDRYYIIICITLHFCFYQ